MGQCSSPHNCVVFGVVSSYLVSPLQLDPFNANVRIRDGSPPKCWNISAAQHALMAIPQLFLALTVRQSVAWCRTQVIHQRAMATALYQQSHHGLQWWTTSFTNDKTELEQSIFRLCNVLLSSSACLSSEEWWLLFLLVLSYNAVYSYLDRFGQNKK